MATIRNSISLQDRMTPVFRSIIKSMDSTMRVMRNLDKQANNGVQSKAYRAAQRDIKRANNELIKMQNHLDRADRTAGKLATTTNKVATNMSRMRSGGFNLTNLASGLYLLKNIANTLSDIMETPDTLGSLEYRLGTYDTTKATGSQLFDASYLAAMRSRSDLESTAGLASRILISGATNGNGAEAIDLAETLNKASFLGGSSSAESQRALLQLSQALASGVLQGDELRAIREQAPGLTDTLAKGLSSLAEKGALPEKFIGTTMGDLKSLGSEGELTADRVIAAFREMGDYVDTTFENSPKQFGQAMTGIGNIWKRWLKLMGQGDNALAKINDRAWKLMEWFASDSGEKFFMNLAKGFNFVVDCIFAVIDWTGRLIDKFNNLENSSNILKAALFALAIVGAAAAVFLAGKWIASWISMLWPVLLAVAVVGILIYALYEAGYTTSEIVGGICGAFAFMGYVLYDIIIWLITVVYWAISLVWDGLVGLAYIVTVLVISIVTLIILALQSVVQIALWVITTLWAGLVTLYNILYTIVKSAWGILKASIVSVYALFVGLGEGVLGILYGIASAIDWIFGSNLADAVGGWMSGLGKSVKELENTLDPLGEFEDIGAQWSVSYGELGDMYAGRGAYDDWNITDNMSDVVGGAGSLLTGVGDTAMSWMLDPTALDSWAVSNTANPMDGWNAGYTFGSGLVDDVAAMNVDMGLSDISSIEELMNTLATDGLGVNGGDLDSVGNIKSDVDISDEDLKLLQEMAARDFLLNLQTVTPQANITFGDVRETADINKIMEVIQDMVDEELATSLVVD